MNWNLTHDDLNLGYTISSRLLDQINFSRHFTAVLGLVRKNRDLSILEEDSEILTEIRQIRQWRLENEV